MSALQPVAMKILAEEVASKYKKVQYKVVLWDNIKENPPEELKVSSIVMIPHTSQLFRSILNFSFALRLKNGELPPYVINSSAKTVPRGTIGQLGHSLMRTIHAFAQVGEYMKFFTEQWDIKYEFWRLNCALGK